MNQPPWSRDRSVMSQLVDRAFEIDQFYRENLLKINKYINNVFEDEYRDKQYALEMVEQMVASLLRGKGL
jgi:hypothetical protein